MSPAPGCVGTTREAEPVNDLGIDLELRLVRYFTVVAEQSSFSRAATEFGWHSRR